VCLLKRQKLNIQLRVTTHYTFLVPANEPSPPDSEEEKPSQAAHAVRALLGRHGIPKHRQAAFVGEFFGLSRAASHRRTHGTAAWTLEDLQAIAEKFGETLPEILGGGRMEGGTRATLKLGNVESPCRIWLYPEGEEDIGDGVFVAMESAGVYLVVPASTAGHLPTLRIRHLEIDQSADKPLRIAVLDDDREVTRSICAGLREKGYQASPYNAIDALMEEIKRSPFDGYILDWKLRGGDTVLPLIALIREQTRHGAIALVSGKFRDSAVNTEEVAAASTNYNFQTFEKPAQLDFIVAALARDGLGPARTGAFRSVSP
jgi:ActR/RegA family two-component response regulator